MLNYKYPSLDDWSRYMEQLSDVKSFTTYTFSDIGRFKEEPEDDLLPTNKAPALGPGEYKMPVNLVQDPSAEVDITKCRAAAETNVTYTWAKYSRFTKDGTIRGIAESRGTSKLNPLGPGQYFHDFLGEEKAKQQEEKERKQKEDMEKKRVQKEKERTKFRDNLRKQQRLAEEQGRGPKKYAAPGVKPGWRRDRRADAAPPPGTYEVASMWDISEDDDEPEFHVTPSEASGKAAYTLHGKKDGDKKIGMKKANGNATRKK